MIIIRLTAMILLYSSCFKNKKSDQHQDHYSTTKSASGQEQGKQAGEGKQVFIPEQKIRHAKAINHCIRSRDVKTDPPDVVSCIYKIFLILPLIQERVSQSDFCENEQEIKQ
jgi:hypothetical protein